jgi:protein phosphatase
VTGDAIRQAFWETNQQMITQGNLDAQLHGMGTTAVLTLVVHDRLHVASMGDSRAYLLREAQLRRYTTDHNLAQTLVNLGTISPEAAREHPWRHKLWKHLGIAQWNEGPDLTVLHLRPSDRILLVTDGITDVLTDADLLQILHAHRDTRGAAEACVQNAVSRGTHDDATAVVVDVLARAVPDRIGITT